jgi:hypothetical protein
VWVPVLRVSRGREAWMNLRLRRRGSHGIENPNDDPMKLGGLGLGLAPTLAPTLDPTLAPTLALALALTLPLTRAAAERRLRSPRLYLARISPTSPPHLPDQGCGAAAPPSYWPNMSSCAPTARCCARATLCASR